MEVPASGRRLKAIFPSGHVKSLLNGGDAIAVGIAFASIAPAPGVNGTVAVASAVDIAAMLDKKFRLVGTSAGCSISTTCMCSSLSSLFCVCAENNWDFLLKMDVLVDVNASVVAKSKRAHE